MSIEQTNIVDFVSTSSDDAEVHLTISDHLPWDDKNEHLLLLQSKLNAYLRFIESGEIFKSYPKAKGRTIVISIACLYPPEGDAKVFLERTDKTLLHALYVLRLLKMDVK